jgi:hypothetical protein
VKELFSFFQKLFWKLSVDERGSEITEQIFWIGLILLAIILVLPQLRNVLISKLSDLISALSQ